MKADRKKKFKVGRRGALFFYIAVLAFPVAQFCVFYIGVNFNSILLAFRNYDALSSTFSWAGTANFSRFISRLAVGSPLRFAVKNSLILYGAGLLIGLPLSLLFSYYIYKKARGYNLMRIFLFLPSILSIVVMTIIFINLNAVVLPALGLKDYLGPVKTQFYAVVFFNIWIGFGTGILLYSSAMSRVSDSVVEAARIDGAGPLRQFFNVLIPGIWPTLTVFFVVGIAGIFINQASLYAFFSWRVFDQSQTLGFWLFVKVVGDGSGQTDYPEAAAAGLMMTVIAVPLTLLVKYLLERFGPSEESRK